MLTLEFSCSPRCIFEFRNGSQSRPRRLFWGGDHGLLLIIDTFKLDTDDLFSMAIALAVDFFLSGFLLDWLVVFKGESGSNNVSLTICIELKYLKSLAAFL